MTTTEGTPVAGVSTAERGASAARFLRPDIQALRAIAVVLVILDHLALLQRLPGSPEGGFIGVDVFFVISGFLISGQLLREAGRSGRISFRDFYARRVRRILPMAVIVAVVTVAAAWLLFWPARALDTTADGAWAMLFVSNIAFALSGTDYFSDGAASPFQHYWSLSVEEQFYVVWPFVILLALWIATRLRRPLLRVMLWAIGAAFVVSFAWALFDTAANPAASYFSTLGRAFEFALGALVYVVTSRLARLSRALRWVVGLSGLALIAASVWFIHPDAGFPGPLAIVPALGAALFLAAGTGTPSPPVLFPLATRPVRYVGDISYSLYLWHWPAIVFLGTVLPPTSPVTILLALALTFGLSAVSYHFVEQRILRSRWLNPHPDKAAPARSPLPAIAVVTASILAAVAVFGGAAVLRPSPASAGGRTLVAAPNEPSAAAALVASIQAEIATASDRSGWQDTTPPIDDLGVGVRPDLAACWNDRADASTSCVQGDPAAPRTIAVVGDSIAMNMVPGIVAAAEAGSDWKVLVLAKAGCTPVDVPAFDTDGSLYENCEEFREFARARLTDAEPDVVLYVSALVDAIPGVDDAGFDARWSQGLSDMFAATPSGASAYLMSPTPRGESLASCANRFTNPADCATVVSSSWLERNELSRTSADAAGATYIDTSLWFCDTTGLCPAVIGDTIVRRDPQHLTEAYALSLSGVLAAWLLSDTTVPRT